MGQIQNVSRKILGIPREQVGTKAVDETVVAIPCVAIPCLWRFI
jgi:hypothetical protein